jgi:hypothetical protein
VPKEEEKEEKVRKAVAMTLAAAMIAALVSGAQAEISQKGNLRVSFEGDISPRNLPRTESAPIAVAMLGKITTTDGAAPPALRTFQIFLNKAGHLDAKGIPVCTLNQIQPATTSAARRACGPSLVGSGSFSANVAIPEQSPFPSQGQLLAFNGTQKGKPVIFAHIYGTEPVPTSFTLALKISRAKGTYGTVLIGSLPEVATNIAFVTGIALKLDRTFMEKGRKRGYVSAACPAPKGFTAASFPLAKASFAFADGRVLGSVLNRSCRTRGSD